MYTIDENLCRTVLWGCLADAFRPPCEEPSTLVDDLPEAGRTLGLDVEPFVRARSADRAHEYDRLFGHVVRGPCPAHEGEYGSPKGFRFAHEIGDLEGFYRAFGLQPSRKLKERADHIAVECEFFAFLALKEACALEAHGEEKADICRSASRKFLSNHFGRFGCSFAHRVKRKSDAPFFQAAADLLDAAIRLDSARFEVEAGPAVLPLRTDAGSPEDACVRCCTFDGVPR